MEADHNFQQGVSTIQSIALVGNTESGRGEYQVSAFEAAASNRFGAKPCPERQQKVEFPRFAYDDIFARIIPRRTFVL